MKVFERILDVLGVLGFLMIVAVVYFFHFILIPVAERMPPSSSQNWPVYGVRT